MTGRYWYATGYKTRAGALAELEQGFADGSVSEGEGPKVESYSVRTKTGKATRFGITLEGFTG
jgi:hypothetical protein